jgi:hypothetical protein
VPALGYAVALGLRRSSFDPHLADGVVIMACMPTTVSTNVVYTARAAGEACCCACVMVLYLQHVQDSHAAAEISRFVYTARAAGEACCRACVMDSQLQRVQDSHAAAELSIFV